MTVAAATVAATGLSVHGLSVDYHQEHGVTRAVREVSFRLRPGETLGIVGESGSGKSTIAQALMRLLPESARMGGHVRLGEVDLAGLSEERMGQIRGRRIGMVFQDPAAALNPVFSVGTQIVDTLRRHDPGITSAEAWRRAGEMAESLGVPAARLSSYPHQLSGGMRQRSLIVAAMVAEPSLLIADEPTSDLDTLSQKQIIRLLHELQRERELGILLISHDLGVISALCERVLVMYRGRVVESGPTSVVLGSPRHPYTDGLIRVSRRERGADGRLFALRRRSDDAAAPDGCRFYGRCERRMERCEVTEPGVTQVGAAHSVRCFLYGEAT